MPPDFFDEVLPVFFYQYNALSDTNVISKVRAIQSYPTHQTTNEVSFRCAHVLNKFHEINLNVNVRVCLCFTAIGVGKRIKPAISCNLAFRARYNGTYASSRGAA